MLTKRFRFPFSSSREAFTPGYNDSSLASNSGRFATARSRLSLPVAPRVIAVGTRTLMDIRSSSLYLFRKLVNRLRNCRLHGVQHLFFKLFEARANRQAQVELILQRVERLQAIAR